MDYSFNHFRYCISKKSACSLETLFWGFAPDWLHCNNFGDIKNFSLANIVVKKFTGQFVIPAAFEISMASKSL